MNTPSKGTFAADSTRKQQHSVFNCAAEKLNRLETLDSEWKIRLEKLLNNTNDQDDYFEFYSDTSNKSFSTIRIDSKDSLFSDSYYCSDTDATRGEDIVIQLSESAFYNAKVNPFPDLNFPSTSHRNFVDNHDQEIKTPATELVDNRPTSLPMELHSVENPNEVIEASPTSLPIAENPSENRQGETEARPTAVNLVDDYHEEIEVPPIWPPMELTFAENRNEEIEAPPTSSLIKLSFAENRQEGIRVPPSGINLVNNCHEGLKAPLIEDVTDGSFVTDDQNPTDSSLKYVVNDVAKDSTVFNELQAKDSTEVEVYELEVPYPLTPTSLHDLISITSLNENETEILQMNLNLENSDCNANEKSMTASESQSTLKNSSTTDKRKKHYSARRKSSSKGSDSDSLHTLERQQSKSSGCTKVTSTTTFRVTTDDDSIFELLEDLPGFINSSVLDQASTYISDRLRLRKKRKQSTVDFDLDFMSSSNTSLSSWHEIPSLPYIKLAEAYKRLITLLQDGTNENRNAVMCDRYQNCRLYDEIDSSEEEFLSDLDDLQLTSTKWSPPESELRKQVGMILKKISPLEHNYSRVIDDMLTKYLTYVSEKQRITKLNRIVKCVEKPVSQQEKTEMLIQGEIEDKKLNLRYYYCAMEPIDFSELCERRKRAIVRKYRKCHSDRMFCHNYFLRSIEVRPISRLTQKIAKLKKEFQLEFA